MLDALCQQWLRDPLLQRLIDSQLANLTVLLLVAARMSGVLLVGPLFGQRVIPWHVRIIVVLALSAVITPLVMSHSKLPAEVPASLLVLLGHGLAELAIGSLLGIAVALLVAALRGVSHLLDQQSGMGAGGVLDPLGGGEAGPTTQLVVATSSVLLFVSDAHIEMLRHLLVTFEALPVGRLLPLDLQPDVLTRLIQMSFVLAIRVAVPLLALMTLVSLLLGVLQRSTPQLNLFAVGIPARVLIHLLFVSWMLPGLAGGVAEGVPVLLDQVTHALARS